MGIIKQHQLEKLLAERVQELFDLAEVYGFVGWEKDFVNEVYLRLVENEQSLTVKQAAKVEELWDKVENERLFFESLSKPD
jgi:hypothetical protein